MAQYQPQQIAKNFSQAAAKYKEFDVVQRQVTSKLKSLASLSGHLADIGCGPGTDFSMFSDLRSVTAIDIAQGMLERVQQDYHYNTLLSDVHQLNCHDTQFDCVYSSLVLQWSHDLAQAFSEIYRVLKAPGNAFIAMPVIGSLSELSELGFYVNPFKHPENIAKVAMQTGFKLSNEQVHTHQVYFDDLKALLYSIKGIGAHSQINVGSNKTTARGLSKSTYKMQCRQAELLKTPQGIPLTYQVLYLHITKG